MSVGAAIQKLGGHGTSAMPETPPSDRGKTPEFIDGKTVKA